MENYIRYIQTNTVSVPKEIIKYKSFCHQICGADLISQKYKKPY